MRINHDGVNALKKVLSKELWNVFQRSCARTVFGLTYMDAITGYMTKRMPGMDRIRAIRSTVQQQGSGTSATEVYTADRSTLRGILLSGIEDHVHFGKEFIRYEKTGKGVKAYYTGGHVEEGDILVGTDGVYSRTRRQYLPDHTPCDMDARSIYGKTLITPALLERFNKDATEWTTLIMDNKKVFLTLEMIRLPEDPAIVLPGILASVKDCVYWVLGTRSSGLPPDAELFFLTPQQTATLTLNITEDWHPSIRSLLELQQSDRTSVVRITSG